MSALPVEAVEPDPAATSLPNDTTMAENGDASAPTTEEPAATEVEAGKENDGAASNMDVVKGEKDVTDEKDTDMADAKSETTPKKLRTYDNGVLKTSVEQIEGKNNSRYDPSILPKSTDATKIRNQVIFLAV